MRLTIFGASSATGKLLVEKALTDGYKVIAFVRDNSRLGISHEKLRVVCGDALDFARVESAIKGSDAVLSTLGPKGKPAVMAAEVTQNIVAAMQVHGVKRLIVVSVAGIAVPQDKRRFDPIRALLRLLIKDVFLDRENQLALLESSNVDWVAVRVPRLTDAPATGSVRAFFGNASPMMKVSRADLAEFMLKQLTNDRWVRKAPILSN